MVNGLSFFLRNYQRLVYKSQNHKNILTKIKFIALIALIIIFGIILKKNISNMDLSVIVENWRISLLIVALTITFILTKSWMLLNAGRLFLVRINFLSAIKIFCLSGFFELTTFSGKFGADALKYFFWRHLSRKNRFSLLLFLRTADMLGFLTLIVLLILPWQVSIVCVALTLIIALHELKKRKKSYPESFIKTLKERWPNLVVLSTISMIAYLVMVTQISLIFNALGLEIVRNTILKFLTSHGLGVLSQLPHGLGMKDVSIYYLLKSQMSQAQILSGLIWMRLLGEFISVFLGTIFLVNQLIKKYKKK